ncbi:MAG: hypothetical protein COS89_02840 [Deltaproteobacteria bacterium CG07_land_8_20_14_0_80_38_7]|nr:MAG: hypothetical protein COS89_02840 [Deltaproteobacteria bacterium CG07_land_8_20_14_0_80_38_7]
MWEKQDIRYTLLCVTIVSGFGMVYIPLMPIFVGKIYEKTAIHLGWMMGMAGAGSLLGAVLLARKKHTDGLFKLLIKSTIFFSLSIILFAWIKNEYLAMLPLFIAGIFLTFIFSSANTFLQCEAPERLRGRLMSIFIVTFFALTPVGAIIGGGLSDLIGAPLTVTLFGSVCLLIGLLTYIKMKNINEADLDEKTIKHPTIPGFPTTFNQ